MAQAWPLVYCGYDLLGCVAGNHGGIRSAVLLGFDLTEHSLVGTGHRCWTGRLWRARPVYLVTHGR